MRRIRTQISDTPDESAKEKGRGADGGTRPTVRVKEELVPFMGMKVRRRAWTHAGECKGDYLGVPSDPYLTKILSKQGDRKVLFADKVLKITGSGKMKQRILLITDFAIYLVDPDADMLKRRIALAAVDKLCLSNLSDNFLGIIIPSEYDCLMASTRKTEIVNVLVEATKSTSDYELEVIYSNRFEYHAAADMVKEVQFEEVDGVLHLILLSSVIRLANLSQLRMSCWNLYLSFKRDPFVGKENSGRNGYRVLNIVDAWKAGC